MFYFTEKKYYSQKALSTYNKIAAISKNKSDKVKILVVRLNYKIEKKFLKNFKNLKYVISNTTGLDHIDQKFCESKNIKILSLNDVKEKIKNIYSTADLTLGLLIGLVRKINLSNKYIVKHKKFERYKFISHDLNNLTVGIIGFGRLGRIINKYTKILKMKTISYDIKDNNKNIKNFLSKSDIVVITASSYDGRKILTKKHLQALKKNSYIVNTSRFFSVDENEIIKKLKTGSLLGYAADSIDGEYDKNLYRKNRFLKLSNKYNIILTPHLGGFTYESLNKTEEIMANFFYKNFKNKI
jgi:D-3-phosphoglycerate dehydrogenase / 2-oxoglutarate reductase